MGQRTIALATGSFALHSPGNKVTRSMILAIDFTTVITAMMNEATDNSKSSKHATELAKTKPQQYNKQCYWLLQRKMG